MNLQIGIVGLPNVGKSTLFNALTKTQNAQAANFPFCTIDPNIGTVPVPDERLEKLAEIVQPEKTIPAMVEFVDIAGLVAGASKGEGLGNKFLSHIRECNAVCHVLRDFENDDIHHVSGSVNPKNDWEIIIAELILADLESAQSQKERLDKKSRSGDKEAAKEVVLLEKIEKSLTEGHMVNQLKMSEEEKIILPRFQLITAKPFLVVANEVETEVKNFSAENFREKIGVPTSVPIIPLSAQIESEMATLTREEAREMLAEFGITEPGLDRLIREAFNLLGLQVYFTAGKTEARAWTIRVGDRAPQAAGVIHTDFEKGFIKAEVVSYRDYVQYRGETEAKNAGKLRLEGKEYEVQDGDVIHFRFAN